MLIWWDGTRHGWFVVENEKEESECMVHSSGSHLMVLLSGLHRTTQSLDVFRANDTCFEDGKRTSISLKKRVVNCFLTI